MHFALHQNFWWPVTEKHRPVLEEAAQLVQVAWGYRLGQFPSTLCPTPASFIFFFSVSSPPFLLLQLSHYWVCGTLFYSVPAAAPTL